MINSYRDEINRKRRIETLKNTVIVFLVFGFLTLIIYGKIRREKYMAEWRKNHPYPTSVEIYPRRVDIAR